MPRIILETNAFQGISVKDVERLARAGFTFSVSEIALGETIARSRREFLAGTMDRPQARMLLFGRARRLRPYIDPQYPIAVVARPAVERVRQQLTGAPLTEEVAEHIRRATLQWEGLFGTELTDEEWLAVGANYDHWYSFLDTEFAKRARRNEELWERVAPEGRDEKRRTWDSLTREDQIALHVDFWRESAELLDDRLFERFDGWIRSTALRFVDAASGARTPKTNDGADVRLPVHVGEDAFLLCEDKQLIKIIDASGTVQAPWVRRLADFDQEVPDGPPWGDNARRVADGFKRRW